MQVELCIQAVLDSPLPPYGSSVDEMGEGQTEEGVESAKSSSLESNLKSLRIHVSGRGLVMECCKYHILSKYSALFYLPGAFFFLQEAGNCMTLLFLYALPRNFDLFSYECGIIGGAEYFDDNMVLHCGHWPPFCALIQE